MASLKEHEEVLETLNTLFLVDGAGRLKGTVPLARLFTATSDTPLIQLAPENLMCVDVKKDRDEVTELFDKYNLLNVPVVDEQGKLSGVITADDVISVLRQR